VSIESLLFISGVSAFFAGLGLLIRWVLTLGVSSSQSPDGQVVKYGMTRRLFLVCVSVAVPLGLYRFWSDTPEFLRSDPNVQAIAWIVLGIVGVVAPIIGLRDAFTRVSFDHDSIAKWRWFARPQSVRWRDIQSVRYRSWEGHLVLTGFDGNSLKLPESFVRKQELLDRLQQNIPCSIVSDALARLRADSRW
jgi:hypothetical protein